MFLLLHDLFVACDVRQRVLIPVRALVPTADDMATAVLRVVLRVVLLPVRTGWHSAVTLIEV